PIIITTITMDGPMEIKLTHDQEAFFKQQLLKYSVMEEITMYFADAEALNQTLFLRFLFNQLTSIPLLTHKEQAKIKFRQLIHTLPKMIIQSQMASKQETGDQFRKFVVKVFDVALRTPQEKDYDKKLKLMDDPVLEQEMKNRQKRRYNRKPSQQTLDDKENDIAEEEREKNPKDIERDESIAKHQKRLTELTHIIIMNFEKKSKEAQGSDAQNGISGLFNIVLKTKNFRDLPSEFTEFTLTLIKIMSLWMERELRDPKQLQKMKKLYTITPIKAIRASLTIANPITLLKGFIALFLAKPFGARNLIQTFTSVLVESGKTEQILKKAQKDAEISLQSHPNKNARKLLIGKMKGFVMNIDKIQSFDGKPIATFKEVPEPIQIMQYQWPSSPSMDPDLISTLTEEHFTLLFEYVKMEKRKKEKDDFIEVLGNEEMIEIIRELLPVLYEPLGKLFTKANIGYHFERVAHCIKKIITVAEFGELKEEDDQDLDLQQTATGASEEYDDYNTPVLAKSVGNTPTIGTPDVDHVPTSHSQPPSPVTHDKNKGSGSNLLNKFNWLKPSNLFSPKSTSPTSGSPQQQQPHYNQQQQQSQQQQQAGNCAVEGGPVDINAKVLKKKFRKDKSAAITMQERLALFEDVNYILMERIYDMFHDLVSSDAKQNVSNNGSISTGLLSQSVTWLLGLLQFLKDEEVDVTSEIFGPLSPSMKDKVLPELDKVIEYQKYRIEQRNIERRVKEEKEAAERELKKKKQEKEQKKSKKLFSPSTSSPTLDMDGHGEENVEEKNGPEKPKVEYLPQMTGPFIELVKTKLDKLGDPTKYSVSMLSRKTSTFTTNMDVKSPEQNNVASMATSSSHSGPPLVELQ
ncbi:hypothetical protein SAMD00019534_101800, partial [Acytostelium subglobosum LB1]|uniref:hypothetical protein n=1 Tax=Acytostelium subglobosum LB1 TaxID=1410327 RepID=UPI000644AB6C